MALLVDITPTLSRPTFGGLKTRLAFLKGIATERAQLAALDAGQLADIGLTAEQAREEAGRPFWDAPTHWRR